MALSKIGVPSVQDSINNYYEPHIDSSGNVRTESGTFQNYGSFISDDLGLPQSYYKPTSSSAYNTTNGIDLTGAPTVANAAKINSLGTSKTNWGMDGWGGFGIGLGQLGLGLASYLDNAKTAKAQRNLMGQQAKQNDYNYNKTVADNKHIQQIFNPGNK